MMLRSISLSLIVSLAAPMTPLIGAGQTAVPAPAVARVGQVVIAASDVALRVAVIEAREPGDLEPGDADGTRALTELLLETLESEVARGLGVSPTAEDLATLGRHAAATSRDPATLARLRDLLDDDGFARHVLAPRATSLKLRHTFDQEPALRNAAYDTWYRERAMQVPIVLLEPPSASAICAAYSGVWWLEGACSVVAARDVRRRSTNSKGAAAGPASARWERPTRPGRSGRASRSLPAGRYSSFTPSRLPAESSASSASPPRSVAGRWSLSAGVGVKMSRLYSFT